jgi:transposase
MAKAKTLVGLDVHATKIVAAVLDAETGQLQTFGMSGENTTAAGFCAGLPRPVRVAYEAGPTGYGLARELARRGVECVVAAPSKIPRASGDRVKTDRRDAEHLVRLLLAGKLHAVRVPGAEEVRASRVASARQSRSLRSRHRLGSKRAGKLAEMGSSPQPMMHRQTNYSRASCGPLLMLGSSRRFPISGISLPR